MVRPTLPCVIANQRAAEDGMKIAWQKPVVVEQDVGLEVTSYASAELD